MTAHRFLTLDRIADILAGHADDAEAVGNSSRAAILRSLAKDVRRLDAPPSDGMVRVVTTPPEGADFDMT
jgi:hypothetical protein